MFPSRRQAATLSVCIALVLGACAMPQDSRPEAIALGDEHAEVLEPAPTTETTQTTISEFTREVGLWFILDDDLRRQSEQLDVSQATSLTAVLNELTKGTRQENHRSDIPSGVEVLFTRINDRTQVATIVLADNTLFNRTEGNGRLRAIAQFVFTATDRNRFGVDRVLFEIDGNIRTIPVAAGSDTSDPVGRCDYEDFWPEANCSGATTTTTAPPAPPDPTSTLNELLPDY